MGDETSEIGSTGGRTNDGRKQPVETASRTTAVDTTRAACMRGISRHSGFSGLKQEAGGGSRAHDEILLKQFFDFSKFFFM